MTETIAGIRASLGTLFGMLFGILVLALPHAAIADSVGTLTLDVLSFVSFQDNETLLLPAGSTLQFHFGDPDANGDVPFSIAPSDVSISEVDIPGDERTLVYGRASVANGFLRPTPSGHIIEFSGTVGASFSDVAGTTLLYPIDFTTETVSATDTLHSFSIEVTGLRLVDGVWYAQIVGATTNHENAFPEPGAAVYSVLSGTFDQLPIAP